MTRTALRARRFHHLSGLQQTQIYREIEKAIEPYRGLRGLTARTKETMSVRLARKFGVPRKVILDVYEYRAAQRHEAEVIHRPGP
ncbi:hypothetical protein PBI_SEBATA_224 [Mycobacterium phage Sebata]|uniref:Uncharacterized protein n=1 Tax=Mycobacterium phage Sebata TaxID=1052672 RepID=G1FIT5_9CAUD|nr:hypothetical protein FDI20_gp124 [Mycobacterium phage Sebata]AEK06667.1 hypothetical protein PBI_SEBATA_224 [Mycobacterium phage Sebata]